MSNEREKSVDSVCRRARLSSAEEKKIIGLVENEDYAIGRRSSSQSGSLLERKISSLQLHNKEEENVKMDVAKRNSIKLRKKENRKIYKLFKLLRKELTDKNSKKLPLFDGLEKMYKKLIRRSKSSRLSEENVRSNISSDPKSTSNVDESKSSAWSEIDDSGFEIGEELTADEEKSVKMRKEQSMKSNSRKSKPNAIKIKIAPKVDPNDKRSGLIPQSLINIEQIVDEDNPLMLKVNNQTIDSKNKFETLINFPETIDIVINSPESRTEIRLPGSKTPESESTKSPQTKLSESESTCSDLRSLFEAYKTDTSNFSTAFKPSSQSSSKQESRTTTPVLDTSSISTTPDSASPNITLSDTSQQSSLSISVATCLDEEKKSHSPIMTRSQVKPEKQLKDDLKRAPDDVKSDQSTKSVDKSLAYDAKIDENKSKGEPDNLTQEEKTKPRNLDDRTDLPETRTTHKTQTPEYKILPENRKSDTKQEISPKEHETNSLAPANRNLEDQIQPVKDQTKTDSMDKKSFKDELSSNKDEPLDLMKEELKKAGVKPSKDKSAPKGRFLPFDDSEHVVSNASDKKSEIAGEKPEESIKSYDQNLLANQKRPKEDEKIVPFKDKQTDAKVFGRSLPVGLDAKSQPVEIREDDIRTASIDTSLSEDEGEETDEGKQIGTDNLLKEKSLPVAKQVSPFKKQNLPEQDSSIAPKKKATIIASLGDLPEQADSATSDINADKSDAKSSSIKSKLDVLNNKSPSKGELAKDEKSISLLPDSDGAKGRTLREPSKDATELSETSTGESKIRSPNKRKPSLKLKSPTKSLKQSEKRSPKRRQSIIQKLLSPIRALSKRRGSKSKPGDQSGESDDKSRSINEAQNEMDQEKIASNRQESLRSAQDSKGSKHDSLKDELPLESFSDAKPELNLKGQIVPTDTIQTPAVKENDQQKTQSIDSQKSSLNALQMPEKDKNTSLVDEKKIDAKKSEHLSPVNLDEKDQAIEIRKDDPRTASIDTSLSENEDKLDKKNELINFDSLKNEKSKSLDKPDAYRLAEKRSKSPIPADTKFYSAESSKEVPVSDGEDDLTNKTPSITIDDGRKDDSTYKGETIIPTTGELSVEKEELTSKIEKDSQPDTKDDEKQLITSDSLNVEPSKEDEISDDKLPKEEPHKVNEEFNELDASQPLNPPEKQDHSQFLDESPQTIEQPISQESDQADKIESDKLPVESEPDKYAEYLQSGSAPKDGFPAPNEVESSPDDHSNDRSSDREKTIDSPKDNENNDFKRSDIKPEDVEKQPQDQDLFESKAPVEKSEQSPVANDEVNLQNKLSPNEIKSIESTGKEGKNEPTQGVKSDADSLRNHEKSEFAQSEKPKDLSSPNIEQSSEDKQKSPMKVTEGVQPSPWNVSKNDQPSSSSQSDEQVDPSMNKDKVESAPIGRSLSANASEPVVSSLNDRQVEMPKDAKTSSIDSKEPDRLASVDSNEKSQLDKKEKDHKTTSPKGETLPLDQSSDVSLNEDLKSTKKSPTMSGQLAKLESPKGESLKDQLFTEDLKSDQLKTPNPIDGQQAKLPGENRIEDEKMKPVDIAQSDQLDLAPKDQLDEPVPLIGAKSTLNATKKSPTMSGQFAEFDSKSEASSKGESSIQKLEKANANQGAKPNNKDESVASEKSQDQQISRAKDKDDDQSYENKPDLSLKNRSKSLIGTPKADVVSDEAPTGQDIAHKDDAAGKSPVKELDTTIKNNEQKNADEISLKREPELSPQDIDAQKNQITISSPVSDRRLPDQSGVEGDEKLAQKLITPTKSADRSIDLKPSSQESFSSSDSKPYLTFSQPEEQEESKETPDLDSQKPLSLNESKSYELFSHFMAPQASESIKPDGKPNSNQDVADNKAELKEKPKISLTVSHPVQVPGVTDRNDEDSLALSNQPEIVYDSNLEDRENLSSLQSEWLTDIITNEDQKLPESTEKTDKSDNESRATDQLSQKSNEGYSKDDLAKVYDHITKAIDKLDPVGAPFLQEERDKNKRENQNKSLRSERKFDDESMKSKSPMKFVKSHKLIETNLKDIVESLNESLKLIDQSRYDSLKNDKLSKSPKTFVDNKPTAPLESVARDLIEPVLSTNSDPQKPHEQLYCNKKTGEKMKKCEACNGLGFLTLKDQNKFDS